MKLLITLLALTTLLSAKAFSQFTQDFNTSNSITTGCNLVTNADFTNASGEVIHGTGSLYSNPPVSGSSSRDYTTPYLNMTSTSLTVSFYFMLTSKISGQATRTIEIGLQGTNSFTSLTTITFDKNNSPSGINFYSNTFTVPTGVSRLSVRMGGATGAGNSRLILDDLVVSANPYYTLDGTCNLVPSIQDDLYFTPVTSIFTGTSVLANDSEPNGETLSAPTLVTPSPDGTVLLNSNGTFTFTPNPGFTGASTTFTYRVSDNGYDPMSGTATVIIFFQSSIVLPVHITNFQASLVKEKAQLNWTVADNEAGEHFIIEKSIDGKSFASIGTVAATAKAGAESYEYNETTHLEGEAFYRIRWIHKNTTESYTKVILLKNSNYEPPSGIGLLQNPIRTDLAFTFVAAAEQRALINLYSITGAKIQSFDVKVHKGANAIIRPINHNLTPGIYVLEVVTATGRITAKLTR